MSHHAQWGYNHFDVAPCKLLFYLVPMLNAGQYRYLGVMCKMLYRIKEQVGRWTHCYYDFLMCKVFSERYPVFVIIDYDKLIIALRCAKK